GQGGRVDGGEVATVAVGQYVADHRGARAVPAEPLRGVDDLRAGLLRGLHGQVRGDHGGGQGGEHEVTEVVALLSQALVGQRLGLRYVAEQARALGGGREMV